MINRGGLKVFPDEVAEVIRLSPDVADVAWRGVPDDRLGEVPWAFVVPAPGATVDATGPSSPRSAASTSRRTRCPSASSCSTRSAQRGGQGAAPGARGPRRAHCLSHHRSGSSTRRRRRRLRRDQGCVTEGVARMVPSAARLMHQPPSWWSTWWRRQSSTRLSMSVGPPRVQCTTWCTSHHLAGARHPGC